MQRGASHLWVIDAKGGKAEVTIPNVMQSNGVIQVINKVLLPGLSAHTFCDRGDGAGAFLAPAFFTRDLAGASAGRILNR